jgi:hypothetical protein
VTQETLNSMMKHPWEARAAPTSTPRPEVPNRCGKCGRPLLGSLHSCTTCLDCIRAGHKCVCGITPDGTKPYQQALLRAHAAAPRNNLV